MVAGGGTGGHVYPAISIGQALEKDAKLLFVGDPGCLEATAIPKAGFDFRSISGVKVPKTILGWFGFFGRMLLSINQGVRLILTEKPSVVVGVGGWVSVPLLLSALLLRCPVILHEQNVRPGRANRLFARFGVPMMTTFEESSRYNRSVTIHTGLPVRREIGSWSRQQARQDLSLPEHAFIVLIVGGSGGSAVLNEIAEKLAAGVDVDQNIFLVHIAGRTYQNTKRDMPTINHYRWIGYTDKLAAYYCAADLLISRSGASTLNEIFCSRRASILVPSPNVAEHHQDGNAKVAEDAGAAQVIYESHLTVSDLMQRIHTLQEDQAQIELMEAAAYSLCTGESSKRRIRDAVLARAVR
jgi:UDP-N-acetylglucosamine--N-acetylmuramyl-(pentapeptide) pyrophosphoryl-undecaprenol N-acetylglucosamine transferase